MLFKYEIMPRENPPESWYSRNIWSPIIDDYINTDPYLRASRGEVGSQACKDRVNRKRASQGRHGQEAVGNERTSHGLLSDALFHQGSVGYESLELGAMELSRRFGGEFDKKWNEDSRKLIRQMRDMVVRMNKRTKGSESVLRSVQCIGIIAAGKYIPYIFFFPCLCSNRLHISSFSYDLSRRRYLPAVARR